MLSTAKDYLANNKTSIFYRIAMFFITSVFLSNIPLILFLVYMGHYGFFSYDFYLDGVFGIKVFFILVSILLMTFSVCFFCFFIPLLDLIKNKNMSFPNLFYLILSFIVNVLFIILISIKVTGNPNAVSMIYLLIMSAIIMTHICCMIHYSTKIQFGSLIGLVLIVLLTTFFMRKDTVSFVSMGLKIYGAGGNIAVVLKMKDKDILHGNLILLTPENIFLKLDSSNEISIIQRNDINVITLDRKSDQL